MSTVLVRFAGDTANLERAMAKLSAEAKAMGVEMETSVKKAGLTQQQVMKKNADYNQSIIDSFSGAMKKVTLGIAAAAAAAGIASVTMAAKFQQSMELLHTQAGVAQDQIQALSKDVLSLAPQVGTGPDQLAQALFHVESTLSQTMPAAERTAAAMDRVKIAAMGAKVGNSDLVDTTNALNAVMASQISGTENMSAAMGALNATVGSGDMHMQDLADAMGSGMLAVVKTFGVSLNDVGAALATFGDNNIRGADAATALVQAVRAFGVPVKGGAKALAELGLTSDQLAKDMAHGGLNQALTDLVDHLHKSGVSSTDAGALLTSAFGKKAGNGIAVLVDQFARFQSKVEEVQKGAGTFGDAWAQTTKTFAFQVSQVTAQFKAWGDEIGLKLIPYVQKLMTFVEQHTQQIKILAAEVGVVLVGAFAAWAVVTAEVWVPIAAIGAALAGLSLAVMKLWETQAWFRDAVKVAWDQIQLVVAGVIDVLKVDFALWGAVIKGTWDTVIQPTLKAFASTFLVAADEIINGAAKAFGWVPGIGPKLKQAAADFNQFTYDVNGALGNIIGYKHITVQADLIVGAQASDALTNMTAGKVAGARAAGLAALAAAGKAAAKAVTDSFGSGIGAGGGGGASKSNTLADKLKQAIDAAQTQVTDAKQKMADAGKQIANGLISGFGTIADAFKTQHGTISDFILGKGLVQESDGSFLAGQMQMKAQQMVAFAAKIKQLRAAGLNGVTLGEVVNAGIETGTQMADALLSDKATIKSINSSEATIQSAAGSIGAGMASDQYGPQIVQLLKQLVTLQHETPAQYAKALNGAASASLIRARTVTAAK